MTVALIDYGAGNLHSVHNALRAAGADGISVTADPATVGRADRVVLPGVGAYADCRRGIDAVDGLRQALTQAVEISARPFLGICVGMQLMSSRGLEKTTTSGFDWIRGDVVKIKPADAALKIPQIGWNTLDLRHPHPLFAGIPTGADGLHAYFVHSYHLAAEDTDDLVATTPYGQPVTAFVARGNTAGAQFHPEKSQMLGLALIANFLRWAP